MKRARLLSAVLALMAFCAFTSQSQTKPKPADLSKIRMPLLTGWQFRSSIDYTGRWKALQYYARRFYNDILLSPHQENGSLNFYIVSDQLQAAAAQLKV